VRRPTQADDEDGAQGTLLRQRGPEIRRLRGPESPGEGAGGLSFLQNSRSALLLLLLLLLLLRLLAASPPKPWAWVLGRAGGRKNHKCDEEKEEEEEEEEEEERKITDRPVFLKIKVPRRSPLWADIRITPACNN